MSVDPIVGATVGQLIDLLSEFPEDTAVVMRTYHKADVCPVVAIGITTLSTATDITRVELRSQLRRI